MSTEQLELIPSERPTVPALPDLEPSYDTLAAILRDAILELRANECDALADGVQKAVDMLIVHGLVSKGD